MIIGQKNWMIEKTISLSMIIQQHHEKIIFDIVFIIKHDIVLKIFWLKKHNFDVNWKKKIFTWKKHQNMKMLSTHWQNIMIDEISNLKKIARREITISTKKDDFKRKKSDSTDINQGEAGHEVKNTEKNHAISKDSLKRQKKKEVPVISNVYKKWRNLFQEKELTKELSRHQSWNHEIKLISEMKFTFESLYAFFETELKKLRNYLNEELKKGIIRKSTSETGYPILFTSKKNEKFRLYVDYQKLNDIMIKNRYSLSNIKKLQNRLQKAIIFFKLDLRWKYNLIRIKKEKKWKTTFQTQYELYEYTIMSFEFTNASATFQKLMNNVLKKYLNDFIIIYFDNILIYSTNEKNHERHVKKIFIKFEK